MTQSKAIFSKLFYGRFREIKKNILTLDIFSLFLMPFQQISEKK